MIFAKTHSNLVKSNKIINLPPGSCSSHILMLHRLIDRQTVSLTASAAEIFFRIRRTYGGQKASKWWKSKIQYGRFAPVSGNTPKTPPNRPHTDTKQLPATINRV